ncbi:hypothetical protein H1230_19230 [Paenibacillus sp. 19GGS1-52]|uniref:hypothetical protein n=1 Tax=Paenibacillus sp. 19GGS1-52 TaxID=2758563 RepID=UPI001EFB14E7|nr:hypothetical protein [Paenibacillus sp. 19GGS1-52]ULO05237.1 hypothetical protein H1230_19230 [Paenibacillus sp. 19GGS1-52]
MAQLTNITGDIYLKISFHQRSSVIMQYKDDINNWIPIDFEVNVFNEFYKMHPTVDPKLNLFEVNLMISKLRALIDEKEITNKFEKKEISTFEFFYELEFYDLVEENEIQCTVWMFEASRTCGKIHHVDRGFRFSTTLESLIIFTENLEQELKQLLGQF